MLHGGMSCMGACLGHPCQGCATTADKTVSLPLVDILLPLGFVYEHGPCGHYISSKVIDVVLNVDNTFQHVTWDKKYLVSMLGKRDHVRDARGTTAGG